MCLLISRNIEILAGSKVPEKHKQVIYHEMNFTNSQLTETKQGWSEEPELLREEKCFEEPEGRKDETQILLWE